MSITFTSIDGTFPIAGQDNDSQGFRTNFTNTNNNFTTAAASINNILSTGVFVGANVTNSMAGATIGNVKLASYYESFLDHRTLLGSVTLDFSQYDVHKVTTSGNITVAFANWPGNGDYAKLRFWANVTSLSHTITFPSTVTVGIDEVTGGGLLFVPPATGDFVFEFSTADSGTNVVIEELIGPGTTGNAAISGLQTNVTILQNDVVTLTNNLLSVNSNVTTTNGNITALEANVVYTNTTNNLAGNVIQGATQSFHSQSYTGLTDQTITLNFSTADFNQITCTLPNANVILANITNWPAAGSYAKLGAIIYLDAGKTLTFPANVQLASSADDGGSVVVGNITDIQNRIGHTLTSLVSGNFMFEFSTFDGGASVHITQKSVTF